MHVSEISARARGLRSAHLICHWRRQKQAHTRYTADTSWSEKRGRTSQHDTSPHADKNCVRMRFRATRAKKKVSTKVLSLPIGSFRSPTFDEAVSLSMPGRAVPRTHSIFRRLSAVSVRPRTNWQAYVLHILVRMGKSLRYISPSFCRDRSGSEVAARIFAAEANQSRRIK